MGTGGYCSLPFVTARSHFQYERDSGLLSYTDTFRNDIFCLCKSLPDIFDMVNAHVNVKKADAMLVNACK